MYRPDRVIRRKPIPRGGSIERMKPVNQENPAWTQLIGIDLPVPTAC
jgi:hypothetical protein